MSKAIPTPEQLDKFLGRLGSEDAFREKFLGDPVSAFAEHGLEVSQSEVPGVRTLPTKETFKAQAAAIREKANGKSCLAFFALGA